MFEPIWNNKYIEKVEISLFEKNGIEGRGKLYESLGALRDVGQNHLLMMLSLIAIVVYPILAVFYPAPPGFLTLLVVMLFLGSVQFFVLAILGEYLGRIFEEVKQRPKYIIREIINNHRKTA